VELSCSSRLVDKLIITSRSQSTNEVPHLLATAFDKVKTFGLLQTATQLIHNGTYDEQTIETLYIFLDFVHVTVVSVMRSVSNDPC
jgi:hypothetical protein